jgi:integrase
VSPRRRLPAGIRGRGAVFTCTWRDAAGRQYSRKAGDTLEQAEAFKRRIDDQLALGDYRPTCTTTFATYAESWIEVWPLKDQTRERYRGILRRELLPVFGPMPLAKIHPHTVRTWVTGRSPARCRPAASASTSPVLRSCPKAAQIDGHLDTLPLLGVKMPRSHSRQPAVMTLGEAFDMIDAAPADWQCAIATALFTGLRLGELLALTREDVDLPGRRLNIRATLTEVNGRTPRLRREEPKSRAGYRQVPIVEALAVRLQAHLDTLGPTDEGAVFASPVGTVDEQEQLLPRRLEADPHRRRTGGPHLPRPAAHRRQPAARALRRRARRAEVRPGAQPDRAHRRPVRPPGPRPAGRAARRRSTRRSAPPRPRRPPFPRRRGSSRGEPGCGW